MTFFSSLLTWANVPFVIAFGVAVTFVALQLTGLLGLLAGGGDHEGDAEHDVDGHDGDADADADHEAGADHESDADHDSDSDTDQEHEHAGHVGKDILTGMGVGTMPLSIVWQSFAVCFAFAGLSVNSVYLSRTGALPTAALALSAPVALVFAYVATKLVSKVFGRFAPKAGKTSTSRKDLVGKTGVVISSKVGGEFGEVRIADATGSVLRIICRTLPGEEAISEGREVVFVEYDAGRDLLFVAPFDIDAPRRRPRVRVRATSGEPSGAPPGEVSGVRLPDGDEVTGKPPPDGADADDPPAEDRKNAAS